MKLAKREKVHFYKEVGNLFRTAREDCGLSAEEAAEYWDISVETYLKVENGQPSFYFKNTLGDIFLFMSSLGKRLCFSLKSFDDERRVKYLQTFSSEELQKALAMKGQKTKEKTLGIW